MTQIKIKNVEAVYRSETGNYLFLNDKMGLYVEPFFISNDAFEGYGEHCKKEELSESDILIKSKDVYVVLSGFTDDITDLVLIQDASGKLKSSWNFINDTNVQPVIFVPSTENIALLKATISEDPKSFIKFCNSIQDYLEGSLGFTGWEEFSITYSPFSSKEEKYRLESNYEISNDDDREVDPVDKYLYGTDFVESTSCITQLFSTKNEALISGIHTTVDVFAEKSETLLRNGNVEGHEEIIILSHWLRYLEEDKIKNIGQE